MSDQDLLKYGKGKFTLIRRGEKYVAEFNGCREVGDTLIEAIEKVHRAAAIQRAFDRPIEEIEKELPF